MATVGTTTFAQPLRYPGAARIDIEIANNNLWVLTQDASGNPQLYRSINNGGSWSLISTLTRASIDEICMFIPSAGSVHVAYRTNESSQDRIYWRKYFLDTASWGSEVLMASASNGGVAGAVYSGLDIVVVRLNTGDEYAAIAAGTVSGGSHGATVFGGKASNGGVTYVSKNNIFHGQRAFFVTGSGRIGPSLDITNIGNGKTGNVPHLWLTFGRTSINMMSCTWTGAGWTMPTYAYLMVSSVPAQNFIRGSMDGRRYLAASANPSNTSTVAVYERPAGGVGATTKRTTAAHTAGVIRSCSVSYDYASDDFRVYALGTSNNDLYYTTYDRSAGSFSAWTVVTTTDVLGSPPENYAVRKNAFGNARFDVAVAHAGTPNTVVHYPVTQAYAPGAPVWVSPENGAAQDVAVGLILDWTFVDSDPADTQSAYAVRRQIGAGAFAYWRASDSTWQAAEVKNISGTTSLVLAAAWGAGTDAVHGYAAKTWDSTDLPSVYSTTVSVVPSVKVDPTIVTPTPAQVIAGDSVTVSWTVSEQVAWRVRLFQNPGLILVHDGGWRGDFFTTSYPVPYVLADNTSWTVVLQTRNNEGLTSNEIFQGFTTDFVEPATPSLAFTAMPASGVMRVIITNPAPGGGQPAVLSQELYRRETANPADTVVRVATGLASGATYDDWRAVSGVPYEYRVLVRGVNGSSLYGPWTA